MAEDSPASVSDARAILTGYLNKRMRVVVSDGRVIDGNFLCTDRDRNIVLGNCEEFFSREEVGESQVCLVLRVLTRCRGGVVWPAVSSLMGQTSRVAQQCPGNMTVWLNMGDANL